MFALVDCNSFYASCEQVFRPDLRGKPVVVLSNNDGCVVARSAEAKTLGIEMAGPWHKIEPRVRSHGVVVFSSNYTLYGDFSRRVLQTLGRFVQEVENYSIDESFLWFDPGRDWSALGAEIKHTIGRHTGIPVSVGFGPTKVLAKLANKLAKKRAETGGVFVLGGADEADAILAALSPDDIWGIGERLAARLLTVGVHTALEFKRLDPEIARRILTVVGQRIVLELRGVSCLAIEDVVPAKKNICSAKSFGKPLSTFDELIEPLASYVSRVAEKLRAQQCVAGRLQVFLETNPFQPSDPQLFPAGEVILLTPSNFTGALVTAAASVLRRIWRPGYRWKKVGVMLLEICAETCVQSAFDSPAPETVEKRRRAMAALDAVNRTFGRAALRVGSAAGSAPASWRMRQHSLSPRYTTRWEELPVVAA